MAEHFCAMKCGSTSDRMSHDGVATLTSDEQCQTEGHIAYIFNEFKGRQTLGSEEPLLKRDKHIKYLRHGLKHLPESFRCLDASRPWLVYWILHSHELLGITLDSDTADDVVDFLSRCQDPEGGFGGGPGQFPHLAPTYAAVNALVIIGTQEAYDCINREKLFSFLSRMKQDAGGFTMHEGGEVDIRGVYCAVSVARLTNTYTEQLFKDTCHWIASCQTYEGGFSGAPGLEAHGGYTFCGLAALALLGKQHLCHTKPLLKWAVHRQMRYEGGFQGRTNKLVDGCYSFWQGGLFPILHNILSKEDGVSLETESWLFQQEALQEYLLICCQASSGGLIDKPCKPPDYYHTCYTLSGMSVAQHFCTGAVHKKCIVGNSSNELALTHPLYNVGIDSVVQATRYFQSLDIPKISRVEKTSLEQDT